MENNQEVTRKAGVPFRKFFKEKVYENTSLKEATEDIKSSNSAKTTNKKSSFSTIG